jgi:hypothetical protein
MLTTAAAFSGCATTKLSRKEHLDNPMISSLDGINRESLRRVENGYSTAIGPTITRWFGRQAGYEYRGTNEWHSRATLALSGVSPFNEVGKTYYWSNGASPVMAIPITGNCTTQILTGVMDSTAGRNELTCVATLLAECEALTDQLMNKRRLYLAKTLEKAAEKGAKALEKVSEATSEAPASPAKTEPNDLENEINSLVSTLAQKRTQIRNKVIENQLLVFSWAQSASTKNRVSASGIGSYSASAETAQGGIALVSGLRIQILEPGTDLKTILKALETTDDKRSKYHFSTTTYLLQTKNLVTVSDQSAARASRIQLDITKLLKTVSEVASQSPAALEAVLAIQLDVEREAAFAQSLSNTASLTGFKWSRVPFALASDLRSADAAKTDTSGTDDWVTIYSVLTHGTGLGKND